jgi:hypothetical protein
MAEVTRQEQHTSDNADQTTDQVNPSRIDSLAKELEEFLRPGGTMLITDLQKEDGDFLRSARHLMRLRSIHLTSTLVRLQLQELQEKEVQILEAEASYSLNSTDKSTSQVFTTSSKPNESTNISQNVLGSQSSITKSKNASVSTPSQTKKS